MATRKNESINIQIFYALKVSEKSRVPVLIMSNPGLGKSTTVSMYAKVRGYELRLLRGNSTTAEEVLGYDIADQSESSKSTKHLRPSWFNKILEDSKAGKSTLLFLDEITTANEFVQSALLHLIFERMVGDEYLPEDTLIVSAGNYAQNLSNTMNLLPPLMNRFLIFNIKPTAADLSTFLCKYEGSIASKDGKPKDFIGNLYKTMKELDKQEEDFSEDQLNRIGEFIERGIKDTTNFLMTSGEKPIDMAVTDLQSIYSDMEDDSKLFGFVTYRTLNYLRDVTIFTFKCFGKAGIHSDTYVNMIDGLCGIGISRDKSGEVKVSQISKAYFDCMINIVNDIEKMKNNSLKKYENFFNDISKDKKIFEVADMNAIVNKLNEMMRDKDLDNIERPIDPSVLSNICDIVKDSGKNITKLKISTSEKLLDKISAEQFMGNVCYWNTIAELVTSIQELIDSSKTGYKQDIKNKLKDSQSELRNSAFKLRSMRKIILKEDPAIGNTIPEVKNFQ